MLKVTGVPAFTDNYLWLVHDGSRAIVIDPGDAAPILAALETSQLALAAILLTHHHADHAGGVLTLRQRFDVPVYGPRLENIPGVTHQVGEPDAVDIPELGLRLEVIDVPGHTRGHIAYHAPREGWLFCGDTLFAGGCGRLFEGTPEQMMASLAKLAALPADTQVYCAHEYTLSNLKFAREVEAGNPALLARMEEAQATRQRGEPTVPSTIGLELATNPFLRCKEPEIVDRLASQQLISSGEPIAVFTALRQWKNSYR